MRTTFKVQPVLRNAFQQILRYLQNTAHPWTVPIGLVVPRTPHVSSYGDACLYAGGAYSHELGFWFDIIWDSAVFAGAKLKPTQPGFVHINSLEFIIVILQLAAVITRLEHLPPHLHRAGLAAGSPTLPILLTFTDNTASKSWAQRAASSSATAQGLLFIYCELLCCYNIRQDCEHIAGVDNGLADDISRPANPPPSAPFRAVKLLNKHPFMKTWDVFQPNPKLMRMLTSQLFTAPSRVPRKLPRPLGQFVPTASIISSTAI
jgi:hypothetical protein